MKKSWLILMATAALIVWAAATASTQNKVTVQLKNGQGEDVGTATIFPPGWGGVRIILDLKNLTPGEHAIHIHQMAKCEDQTSHLPARISIPRVNNTEPKIRWGHMPA